MNQDKTNSKSSSNSISSNHHHHRYPPVSSRTAASNPTGPSSSMASSATTTVTGPAPLPVLMGSATTLCRLGGHGPTNLMRTTTMAVGVASASSSAPTLPALSTSGHKRKLEGTATTTTAERTSKRLPSPSPPTSQDGTTIPALLTASASTSILTNDRSVLPSSRAIPQYRRNASLGTVSSAAAATHRVHQQRQQHLQQQRSFQARSTSTVQQLQPLQQQQQESPAQYLKRMFEEWKVPLVTARDEPYFERATPERIQAYDRELLMTVRSQDLDKLESQYLNVSNCDGTDNGNGDIDGKGKKKFVNACNPFGESLLHLACRKGMTDVVQFLCVKAELSLFCHDDYGRTVLHDACWTASPQWSLVDFLLDRAPTLLTVQDVRGHLPVDYVPRADWAVWVNYLTSRTNVLKDRLTPTATTMPMSVPPDMGSGAATMALAAALQLQASEGMADDVDAPAISQLLQMAAVAGGGSSSSSSSSLSDTPPSDDYARREGQQQPATLETTNERSLSRMLMTTTSTAAATVSESGSSSSSSTSLDAGGAFASAAAVTMAAAANHDEDALSHATRPPSPLELLPTSSVGRNGNHHNDGSTPAVDGKSSLKELSDPQQQQRRHSIVG